MLKDIPEAFRGLVTETDTAKVSAERLELMGKQASNRFLQDSVPLNASISKLAAEVPGINTEHVKRACEFANQATFKALFEKSAGDDHRCVDFPPADYSEVVQELDDGARPTHTTPTDLDHHRELKPEHDGSMEELFGAKVASAAEIEKTAQDAASILAAKTLSPGGDPRPLAIIAKALSCAHEKERCQDPDQLESLTNTVGSDMIEAAQQLQKAASFYPEANPHRHTLEMFTRVSDLHANLAAQSQGLESMRDAAALDVYEQTKAACMEYGYEATAAVLFHATGKDREKTADILGAVTPFLLAADVPVTSDKVKMAEAMNRIPDPGTPLYGAVDLLSKLSDAKGTTDHMVGQLAAERSRLEDFVQTSGVLAV